MQMDANDELFQRRPDAKKQPEPQVFFITLIYLKKKKSIKLKQLFFVSLPPIFLPHFLEYWQN